MTPTWLAEVMVEIDATDTTDTAKDVARWWTSEFLADGPQPTVTTRVFPSGAVDIVLFVDGKQVFCVGPNGSVVSSLPLSEISRSA